MIRASVRRLVRSIYVMRCGYCHVSEADVGAELTYDHFQPLSHGGSDEQDNLVYACHACNEFKGEYFGKTEDARLLHPLRDDLRLHLRQEADGTLQSITPSGQRYIERLQLNCPPLVLYRQNALRAAQSTTRYEALNDRLKQVMIRIQRIEDRTKHRRR